MAQGRLGRARSSASYRNRVAQQQAVLDQLRSGGAVTGARPANPIIGMLQNLTGVGAGAVPNLYAAQLDGEEVLLGKGGWNQTTAATGPLNVGGRTWYPAQKGKDLVYRPATEAGQYGSILPSDQVAPVEPGKTFPGAQPPAAPPAAKLSPEEQAYNRERSRIAQLTEQNPEFQNIGQLRNDLRDQGMAIWQQKYGGTPMGRTGGAVGSFNPLMDQTFGYQTGMSPAQMAEMQKTAAPIQVAPGQVPYQQGDLGTRATLETGYDPAAFGLTPEKVKEMKKQLLQQASK